MAKKELGPTKPASRIKPKEGKKQNAGIERDWSTEFPFAWRPAGTVHLPVECVVYVPSTRFDKKISPRAFKERRKKTAEELVRLFGGCRESIVTGRYLDNEGQVIEETVAVLTAYGRAEQYMEKRDTFLNWLLEKKREWNQEAIGFEFEDDLWYI